jgi:hydroxylaminobenzene mutase
MQSMGPNEKRLITWGAGLFLIGLLQGMVVPLFENPRMGLSGHLAAVQSGMALMVFALVTALSRWSAKLKARVSAGLIAGLYLIWIGITIAALTGASGVLPHAGQGYRAAPQIEFAVAGLILAGSILSIVTVLVLLIGLRQK